MADPQPRYVVAHRTRPAGLPARAGIPVSYVRDSWYCYREVAVVGNASHAYACRQRAETLAARWNAEHDAWLAER